MGDRYHYLLKSDVWQVMEHTDKHTKVNQFIFGERQVHRYHIEKRKSTEVIFIRHTIPLIGEECMLCDLDNGDVFYIDDDVVTEHVIIKKEFPDTIIALAKDHNCQGILSTYLKIVLVRKSEVTHENK